MNAAIKFVDINEKQKRERFDKLNSFLMPHTTFGELLAAHDEYFSECEDYWTNWRLYSLDRDEFVWDFLLSKKFKDEALNETDFETLKKYVQLIKDISDEIQYVRTR